MGSHVIGIDLGTVNSCVAVVKEGRAIVLGSGNDNRVPSCLALQRGKELVGHQARRQLVTDPHNTVIAVKRILGHPYESPEVQAARARAAYAIKPSPMGDVLIEAGGRELTPIQVSARVLSQIKQVAEEALGTPVSRAVISVPAHFNDVQRKATKQAAEYAGLEVLRLVNEPTAAAFAYGYKKGEDFTLAVYDLGGGTFDITVMEARGDVFEVKSTDGDSYLGGEDFDQAIEDWLSGEFETEFNFDVHQDKAALLRIREAAEKAKVELSSSDAARIDLPFLTQLPDGTRPNFARTLSAEKLRELCQPLVQKTLDLCQRCLDGAGIARTAIDEVLLVGGQSRMAVVREGVQLFFGRAPRRDINPDEVVAMGAALYAYSLVADDLAVEEHTFAEDDYAVAVKQTAIVEKMLTDVQKMSEKVQSKDDGLKKRLSTLLQSIGPARGAPAAPPAPAPDLSSGADAPDDVMPGFEPSPSQGGPADDEEDHTILSSALLDFGDEGPGPSKLETALPPRAARLARSAAETQAPPDPDPSAGIAAARAERARAETQAPDYSQMRASEPDPAPLPEALEAVQGRLDEVGDVAQEMLDALANELADNDDAADIAEEADRLAKELEGTLAAARTAAGDAEAHLDRAEEHQNARRVDLVDVTSHALGIRAAGDIMSVIIEHNTKIPTQAERVFTTNQDGQTQVDIRVFQGREKRTTRNHLLGNFILEGIPPAARMEPKIVVTFRIDADGILAVDAADQTSGARQAIRIEDPLGLQQREPEEIAGPQ